MTEIDSINETLNTHYDDTDYDTIGGLVLNKFGRLPNRGESVVINQYRFTVQRADSRRIYLLKAEKITVPSETARDTVPG